MSDFHLIPTSNVRICCSSLFYVTVNWISLSFGLFFKQIWRQTIWRNNPKMSLSALGNCVWCLCYIFWHLTDKIINPQSRNEWEVVSIMKISVACSCVWRDVWLKCIESVRFRSKAEVDASNSLVRAF